MKKQSNKATKQFDSWKERASKATFLDMHVVDMDKDMLLVAIGSLLAMRDNETKMVNDFLKPLMS